MTAPITFKAADLDAARAFLEALNTATQQTGITLVATPDGHPGLQPPAYPSAAFAVSYDTATGMYQLSPVAQAA